MYTLKIFLLQNDKLYEQITLFEQDQTSGDSFWVIHWI